MVEPTEGDEVESGELRWPPDDVISDAPQARTSLTGEVITFNQ